MEPLTAAVIRGRFGTLIAPDADIVLSFGWTAICTTMLQKLQDLPSDVRAFLVISGIGIDEDGLLHVDLIAIPHLMPPGAMSEIEAIIRDARDLAAWSCIRDHKPGWIVHTGKGYPRPLCPECQVAAGLKPECASA